jgi:rhodanese-related sulfurtransferase
MSLPFERISPMFNFMNSSHLSQDQAYTQLKHDPSIVILDVRTVEEFVEDGHLENSLNVPLHELPQRIATTLPNKDAKIFVICYSGARASEAVNTLKRLGYTNVVNIGGVATWRYGFAQ